MNREDRKHSLRLVSSARAGLPPQRRHPRKPWSRYTQWTREFFALIVATLESGSGEHIDSFAADDVRYFASRVRSAPGTAHQWGGAMRGLVAGGLVRQRGKQFVHSFLPEMRGRRLPLMQLTAKGKRMARNADIEGRVHSLLELAHPVRPVT